MIGVLGCIQSGGALWLVIAFTPGVMSAHFLVEYRTHFTNFHQLVIGGLGATEQLCLIMSICGSCVFFEDGANIYHYELFEVLGYSVRGVEIIVVIAFSTGLQYNWENLYKGYVAAEDKTYAVKCFMPYV